MPFKLIDLTGMTFGRLTVIGTCGKRGRNYYWNCICSCGRSHVAKGGSLGEGSISSCGCLKKEGLTTHGLSYSRVYKIWRGILNRCKNPNDCNYHRYGAIGINVCERWLKFENFFADMGHNNGLQIDRIDNDLGYEPGNCRWATRKENMRNRSNNRMLAFRGETKCVSEWEEIVGLRHGTVNERMRLGWTADRALTTPIRRKNGNTKK